MSLQFRNLIKTFIVLLAVLLSTGCAKKIPLHPGAISDFDSYAYDLLLVEQSAISEARAQFVAGTLPAAAHDSLNTAIDRYNDAEVIWKSYHASGEDSTELQKALNALVSAVGALQRTLGKPGPEPIASLYPMEVLCLV